ncbi:hypothetical protein [Sphingobium ummariense]|uniref:hypothetical protein n=1 Tax=Sphingobium ummariense TaxID=420994 RepID=UPI001F258370|nr:hypothetical protein [Sphingobium ummariense]
MNSGIAIFRLARQRQALARVALGTGAAHDDRAAAPVARNHHPGFRLIGLH